MNLSNLNPSATLNKLEQQQQKASRQLKKFLKQQEKRAKHVHLGSLSQQQICWGIAGFVAVFAAGLGLAYVIKNKSAKPEPAPTEKKSTIIQQG